jgi:hypothetical protein
LRFKPLLGEFHYWAAGAPKDAYEIVPTGTKLIFDYAGFYEGELSYDPEFDDSRMVLRGQPLPPYSGDKNYDGAIKVPVLLQGRGPCELIGTQSTLITEVDRLYDVFSVAAQAAAGELPIYLLQEPRSFTNRQGVLLHAPVLMLVGWTPRDGLKLGPRLIAPPQPWAGDAVMTLPPAAAQESDSIFETTSRVGEVLAPSKPKPAPPRSPVPAGDLDDEIPF